MSTASDVKQCTVLRFKVSSLIKSMIEVRSFS